GRAAPTRFARHSAGQAANGKVGSSALQDLQQFFRLLFDLRLTGQLQSFLPVRGGLLLFPFLQVSVPAIDVCLGVVRLQLDRETEVGEGPVVIGFTEIGDAAIVVGVGKFRVELEGLVKVGDGAVVVAF